MILSLAWRNIWRQPIRTALSVLGMAFTSMLLVFMASFQFGSYDTMKESMLQFTDGHGQFQPEGYKDDPDISRVIADPEALLANLSTVPGVSAAAARATGFALLANGERTFAAMIMGVDPRNEPKVSNLSERVLAGRALTPKDEQAIVLGSGLVRNLRLELGDPVTMLGSGMDGSVAADVLTLVGIFETKVPEIDRSIAQMPLTRFVDSFLMEGAVNTIAVAGDTLRDVVRADARLKGIAGDHGVLFLGWSELRPDVEESIRLDMSTSMLMYSTLVIVVVFIILNTLYMSVLERTREFGVLLAIGMTPGRIGRMVWLEITFLSLVGNGVGMALGIALTAYFQQVGIGIESMDEVYAEWGLPSRFYPAMTPFRVLLGPTVLISAIVLMGIVPYRRALGLDPVEAMAA